MVGVRDLVYYEVPAEERERILQVIAKRLAREGASCSPMRTGAL